ncbi:MAG: DNA polymerase III subunit gamma/tau [Candidatus Hydrothermales bacterium]
MGEENKGVNLNFARKYRPQKFSEIVSQDIIKITLKNAIKMDKLGNEIQALLFAGPRGSGKTSVARIVAKALNCENLKDGEPCDICTSCTEIKGGSSLDVLEIDGASYRGIQEAKSIVEMTKLIPSKFKYKVFIIDEVHMFSKDAFNALLKTLEEPPRRVFFIFATTELHKVPETIQSRCLVFEFTPIPEEKIFERLKEVCEKEKIRYDDEALRLITKSAGGSLRDSLLLLEKALYFTGGEVFENKVKEVIGFLPEELMQILLELISERKGLELLKFLDEILTKYTERDVLRSFLFFLEDVLKGMERNIYKKYYKNLTKVDIIRFMNHIFDVQKTIYFIPDPRILVSHAFYKMIYLPRSYEIEDIIEKGGVVMEIEREFIKEREEEKLKFKTQDDLSLYEIFLIELKNLGMLIYSIFKEKASLKDKSIYIKVKDGVEREIVEKEIDKLKDIIRRTFGSDFELKVEIEQKEKEENFDIITKFEREFSLSLIREEENEGNLGKY